MPLPKKDKFLAEVIYHIKFPFDRDDIKYELECHILEKIDYYTEQGYDKEKAEELSVNDMGDAEVIGIELNKQHNPVIGWLWKITNVMVGVFGLVSIFIIVLPLLISLLITLFAGNTINDIPKSNIVYKINVDEKVKIDDRVVHFTYVVYEKNGNMNILYDYYDTRLWGTGWSLGYIGEITDNLGNRYFAGSGGSRGGIRTRSIRTLSNFSEEADTLIINYDEFNRSYRVEIPLKAGDNSE